ETCNTYNMLRLTRHLYSWSDNSKFMNFYELALYNHILASQNPKDGMVTYFMPLGSGTYKTYSDLEHSFTCCHGTGMENHVKYGDSIYWRNPNGDWLFVSQYIPSTVNLADKGITFELTSTLPNGNEVEFTVTECKKPVHQYLSLRIPNWAEKVTITYPNGEETTEYAPQSSPENEGDSPQFRDGHVVFVQKWKKGDKVKLSFDFSPRIKSMPDNPNRIAILYGPVLLAANIGSVEQDLALDMLAPKEDDAGARVPLLVLKDRDPKSWLRRAQDANGTLKFETVGVGKPWDFSMVPFHTIHDARQVVYFDVMEDSDWSVYEEQHREKIRAERERNAAIEAATVDVLHLGEMQPERDHKLTASEKSYVLRFNGRPGREARGDNYFEFQMKVDPQAENSLLLTYWGSDVGRESIITVDGQALATDKIDGQKPKEFFDITHKIPAELTRDKEKITVRIAAPSNRTAGAVFGVRVLREKKSAATTNSAEQNKSADNGVAKMYTLTDVQTFDPPQEDFFSRGICLNGVWVKSHKDVDPEAVVEAANRIGRLLKHQPAVNEKLAKAGSELQIIGKDQVTSDLPELRHWKGKIFDEEANQTIDERTRGVGGKNASCGEENLLCLEKDRYRGRDICSHEFAHTMLDFGLGDEARKAVKQQFEKSTQDNKLWPGAYAASNEHEYFAEQVMWYVGGHGDFGKIDPRPESGPEWLKNYDPEGFQLIDDILNGKFEM
ncbi:MAG: beta-L-arabinofuranosidase domain-containing protein, partial [Thermoguttaceae bacterium]